jgi:hypothetical protein
VETAGDEFFFIKKKPYKRIGTDAWALRDAFLTISSVDDAKTYLETFGEFGAITVPDNLPDSDYAHQFGLSTAEVPDLIAPHRYTKKIAFRDLLLAQKTFKEFMVASFPQWPTLFAKYEDAIARKRCAQAEVEMARELYIPARLNVTAEPTGALLTVCKVGMQALAAVLQLEKLAGSEYRYCERQDCTKVYKIQSGHKRKFCSDSCAHLVAVRKSRARKNRAKVEG